MHVISPNQHLDKSKILTEEEKKYFSENEYKPIISKYYEKFINFDQFKLNNHLDLRYVFKDIDKTVYRDSCCRFNNLGLEIISEKNCKIYL